MEDRDFKKDENLATMSAEGVLFTDINATFNTFKNSSSYYSIYVYTLV